MRVLIIEDNADIVANLYGFLEPLGYTLDCARNGFAGLSQALESHYDAIILDLMLPGMDGLEVCRKLRKDLRRSTPILMLTARDTLQDKVSGLEHGADDYLVKPFSMVELDARLKALVRRSTNLHIHTVMTLGPLRFDQTTFEATRDGQQINLTPTGYRLLAAFLRQAPGVLTKEQLEYEIWGDNPPDSDALRTHIHTLRQALDKPFQTTMLRTIQGVGYRLVDPNVR